MEALDFFLRVFSGVLNDKWLDDSEDMDMIANLERAKRNVDTARQNHRRHAWNWMIVMESKTDRTTTKSLLEATLLPRLQNAFTLKGMIARNIESRGSVGIDATSYAMKKRTDMNLVIDYVGEI